MAKITKVCIVLLFFLNCLGNRLGTTTVNLTANSSTTVNYTSNLASCICDLRTNQCDLLCCCDTACSSTRIQAWTSSGACEKSSYATKMLINSCQNSGFSLSNVQRFESINCIFFDNRNAIGKYYPSWNGTQPSTNKMGQIYSLLSTTSNIIISNPYIPRAAIKSAVTGETYVRLPISVGGGGCYERPLLIGQSLSYTCYRKVKCSENNNPLSLNKICQQANCSTNVTNSTNPTIVNSSGDCFKIINNIAVTITLTGDKTYVIQDYTVAIVSNITSASVDNTVVPFTATVTFVNSGTAKGGAPGYTSGQSVRLATLTSGTGQVYSLKADVADANGNCLETSANTIQLSFNTPFSVKCRITSCNGSYAIGSMLPTSNLYIPRYGDNTVSLTTQNLVPVKFSSRSSSCLIPAKAVLNILYSRSGTLVDPQYYVVSALVTYTQFNTDTTASFSVKWKYIEPSEISQPVNNLFYQYFEKLWTPLRNTLFGYTIYRVAGGLLLMYVVIA